MMSDVETDCEGWALIPKEPDHIPLQRVKSAVGKDLGRSFEKRSIVENVTCQVRLMHTDPL